MPIFLFRNSDTGIDYCVTDTKSGSKLPPLRHQAEWEFQTELQNSMHAAVFGLMNFEAARRKISSRGYAQYSDGRRLRNLAEVNPD
jgi:hypothetical protein